MKYLKINTFQFSVLLLFAAFLMSSCGKYPEGPGFSLRSKKARVANTWEVEYSQDSDGDENTEDFENNTYEFTKDGDATFTVNTAAGTFTQEGNWEFDNNKEDFVLIFNGNRNTSKILKLKNNEFWIADKDDDSEIHFVPAE